MKNLTIKKIAFGLLLAGYASSSAFATLTATTNQPIQGSAPVLSKVNGLALHTVTVTFTTDAEGNTEIEATDNVKVGNYMKISYKVLDDDGDLDQEDIIKTVTLYKREKDNDGQYTSWKEIDASVLSAAKVITGDSQNGQQLNSIIIPISDDFAGADQIGFKLQERTKYGAPSVNQWISVSDVWSSELPEVSTDGTEPAGLPSDPKGPGDQAPGKGPIVSDTFKVGIFKYDDKDILDTKVNYAKIDASTPTPKYGDKFGAVVWNDADKNGSIDDGELIKTSAYTYKWTLYGNYEQVDATNDALESTKTTADGDTILLGRKAANETHNSMYNTTYKAGAQGYRLKVETNE